VDFNYTKIKFGNWLFRHSFPLYNFMYRRFKLSNDADEIALLEELVKPGSHVLDIGANIGFYARILSRLVEKDGRVYCFEPDAVNFRHLQSNTRGLQNVHIYRQAVSDRKGTLKVYKSKLLNVDHRTYPVSNYDSIEETEAVSIDELIAENIIQRPNVVKIDIQGYELSAFRGMEKLLHDSSSLNIVAEYWPHGFRRAGTSALEFFDFFNERGYSFFVIGRNSLKLLDRETVAANNDKPFEFSFNVLIRKGETAS
jgi:FkbM family methyltransferase